MTPRPRLIMAGTKWRITLATPLILTSMTRENSGPPICHKDQQIRRAVLFNHRCGPSLNFSFDGHIDPLKAVWPGMPVLQLFQNVAGASATDHGVSTPDEFFRHGQPKPARHAGQDDDFGSSFHWPRSIGQAEVRCKATSLVRQCIFH